MKRLRIVQLGALLVLLVATRGPFVPTLHAGICGDNTCDFPSEDRGTCPEDCEPSCGNAICDPWEDGGTCPQDCGVCGDAVCDRSHGEDESSCPEDCLICNGSCSDWFTCESCFGMDFECVAGSCVNTMLCGDWGDSCGGPNDAPCCDGSVCTNYHVCWPYI